MLLLQSVFQKHCKIVQRVLIYPVPIFPYSWYLSLVRLSRKNSVLLLFLLHPHTIALVITFLTPDVCGVSYTKEFCNTIWAPCRLTQFWHCLRIDSIRSHRGRVQSCKTAPPPPTSDASLKSTLLFVLLTNHLEMRSFYSPLLRFHQFAYSGSLNLGKQLTYCLLAYFKRIW